MISKTAECLVNVPPVQFYDSLTNPGRLWNADDQCKLIYGSEATFCKVLFIGFILKIKVTKSSLYH